jgi:hypothetical protein
LFGQLANFVAPLGREAGVCSREEKVSKQQNLT